MARAARESRQQARTLAYSLARALRALAGDFSWERLGRIALLVNATEILTKSLPEASRDFPELTLALLGFILGHLGLVLALLELIFGLLELTLGFLGRSRGSGELRNNPGAIKRVHGKLPEHSFRENLWGFRETILEPLRKISPGAWEWMRLDWIGSDWIGLD